MISSAFPYADKHFRVADLLASFDSAFSY
uniref:Uncharacterized protein n=1 Tax=Rhizophora mucronata TaxID=61149 RepID=A0A2P2N0Q9_RHIMU